MSEDKSKSTIKKSPFKWAIGAALIVWAVWLINFAVLHNSTADLRGTFGDMFGASNAVFSGLALVGLIYAIIQQQEQLDLAREELSTARDDLQETKQLSEEQSDHIQKQNELALQRDTAAMFFQMLNVCLELRNGLRYNTTINSKQIEYIGAQALAHVYSFSFRNADNKNAVVSNIAKRIDYKPYMDSLSNLFLFTENSFEDPIPYFRIVLRSMTWQEMILFGFNSLDSGNNAIKMLIEKRNMLVAISSTGDFLIDHIRSELSPEAFSGKRI